MRSLLAIAVTAALSLSAASPYVYVSPDGKFQDNDSTYRFIGTNFWYGPILASDGQGSNHKRLQRELDSLQALGINNLRILAGAEGPDGLPHHISPVLQTKPGEYNDTLLIGLDRFLAELEHRQMKAVIYLTNAWEWSGGYGSYLQWTGHGKAPVPGIDGYKEYVNHVAQFVLSTESRQQAVDHARYMASRVNTITGRPYSESPAIMSWQICNEPRAFSQKGKEALLSWISQMAQAIKTTDTNHLVSSGSEGMYGCEIDLELWTRIHSLPEIDYAVIHLWPTNWGWASRDSVADHVDQACRLSDEYIDTHLKALSDSGIRKPLVIEEFGYPRDGFRFSPDTPTTARDKYYDHIFKRFRSDTQIAGVNFWGWNGFGRSANRSDNLWRANDDYLCDPAHEPQGMYGVFSSDVSTINLIRKYNYKNKH